MQKRRYFRFEFTSGTAPLKLKFFWKKPELSFYRRKMRWSFLFQNVYSFWLNNWILESYQRRFMFYYLDFEKLWFRVPVCVSRDGWVIHSSPTPFLSHVYPLQALKNFTRLKSKKIDLTHLMPKKRFLENL